MDKKVTVRLEVVLLVLAGSVTQKEGARRLQITPRQMRRIIARYRAEGSAGLRSKHYGRQPPHALSPTIYEQVIGLARGRYRGFAPTFMTEKLSEEQGIKLSIESTRQILMSAGLWKAKRGKEIKRHPLRERRSMFGEMIQIDGSPHDWFEGRSAKCTLLVFIDDATGELTQLCFAPTETTLGYMQCLHNHILAHGMPMSLYSDRHSIFRYNGDADAQTQFGRALEKLGIEQICANSPQAKGRVERMNQTLQDRLVKEMRLAGINGIDEANHWLPSFIEKFNQRFAVKAEKEEDAHVPWLEEESALREILSEHYRRRLSKEVTVSYNARTLQIEHTGRGLGLRKAQVDLREHIDGRLEVWWHGRELGYREIARPVRRSKVVTAKELNGHLDGLLQMHRPRSDARGGARPAPRMDSPLWATPRAGNPFGKQC